MTTSRCLLALAVLPLAAVAGCTRSDDDAESDATVDQPRSETAQVVEYYNAANGGDVEAMSSIWPDGDVAEFELLVNGLEERTTVACAPGETVDIVVCDELVISSAFFSPAGIRAAFTVSYETDGGTITAAELVETGEDATAFRRAFGEWLREADPALFESSYRMTGGRLPVTASGDVSAIVARVGEFVAESETYPLSS